VLTLGLSGGLDLVHQRRDYLFPRGSCHDAAAVLVEDGRVVCGIEEERLNRIKHSSKAPVNAIRFCLEQGRISLNDLDHLVYYGSEETCTALLRNLFYGSNEAAPVATMREILHATLRDGVGQGIDDRKLQFLNHHLCHAVSAFAQSGLSESLVLTLDGVGDGLSGTVSRWRHTDYHVLRSFSEPQSTGILYDRVIAMLGYGFTEEYKVMGLAAYGDPARFRAQFRLLYDLLPQGDYAIHWPRIETLYELAPARKRGQPILREHIDIAAGLQEALELIVFHVLSYYRSATDLPALCLAGGVAHNSTLNGKLLRANAFRQIFVQPASHDAGCALGAALYPHFVQDSWGNKPDAANGTTTVQPAASRITHVYWGSDIGGRDAVRAALARWDEIVDVKHDETVAETAARMIEEGQVLGWVQGRSEFGPRALGNRSIIADPRPAANKDLINALVKKREDFRPFAPAVLEDHADRCFEMSACGISFPFMSFTVPVRPVWRDVLGAVTHVDATARVQTVSAASNPRFHALIEAFNRRTGIPVLLNTSFNNHAEPIVETVDDAVACFLTTGLHALVVDDFLVMRKPGGLSLLLRLAPSLPAYGRLLRSKVFAGSDPLIRDELGTSYSDDTVPIGPATAEVLFAADGQRRLGELIAGDAAAVLAEIDALWGRRLVRMLPPTAERLR
jgi:carbamoyltransferase